MTTTRPRRPDLMTADDPPLLVGHRCGACDRIAFPPDPYGCERCGAPGQELRRHELAAVGTIEAVAVVHRHHRPEPATPFTVATILLEAGVSLKAVVVDGDGASLAEPPPVGAAVRGRAVIAAPHDDGADGSDSADSAQLVDLRFVVVDDGGGR